MYRSTSKGMVNSNISVFYDTSGSIELYFSSVRFIFKSWAC